MDAALLQKIVNLLLVSVFLVDLVLSIVLGNDERILIVGDVCTLLVQGPCRVSEAIVVAYLPLGALKLFLALVQLLNFLLLLASDLAANA